MRLEAELLDREARFRLALGRLLDESLRSPASEAFHRRVIETVVDAVLGAEAGTIWLRGDDGFYRSAAAIGYDDEVLKDLEFSDAEMFSGSVTRDELLEILDAVHESDSEKLSRMLAAGPLLKVHTLLSLPIRIADETIAYLHLHDLEGNGFDEDEVQMAGMIAGNLTLLMQRVRLERHVIEGQASLKRLLSDYKRLAEFSAEIEAIHDTEELIERGMESLLATLRFDTALFSDVKRNEVRFTRVRGMCPPELERTISEPMPLGSGVNGRVVRSGEPLFVEDYLGWPDRHEGYVAAGVQSILALPIRRDGKVRHTMAFGTFRRRAQIDGNSERIAQAFVARLENAFERVEYLEEIEATREATFRALGLALEYRDLETRGHTDRVVSLAQRFATKLGLDADLTRALAWGAYLHDIGKIAVPDTILLKPSQLTDEEFAVVRQHTVFGSDMTQTIPFLPPPTRAVIRSHHERWDGYGYPDRIAGKKIPLLARMFSLVDVYDALTSERPYKRAWAHEETSLELRKQAGKQFDPELVEPFLATLERS